MHEMSRLDRIEHEDVYGKLETLLRSPGDWMRNDFESSDNALVFR